MPPRSYYARIASDILREEHQTNGLSTGALSRIFEVQPVPLKQFIADPYYGISKYDASLHLSEIQEDFVRHFEMVYNMDTYIAMVEEWGVEWTPPRRVNELTAMWGKGAGKDMVARVGFTRLADLLLSLRSPQKYFGIPETDIIHMLNVAASAPQAHRAFYRPLRNLLVAAPRFKDEFLMPPGDLASSIKFSKGIELVSGHSEAETLEGLNLIASCADEISAFKTADELKVSGGKTSNRTADYILDMLRSSSRTRFAENFKLAIISYPRRKDDAVMQALARAEMDINRNGENSRSYASGPHPTWEVNPRQNRAAFQPDYDTDPEMARAKYECDPPLATDRFLRNDYALNNAFSVERLIPPIEVTYFWGHPEAKDVNLLNEEPIEGWQVHYTFAPDFKPMDGALYALHGDLAVRGDRAGFAMSHVKQYQRLVHPDEDLGFTDIEEMRPIMTVDFVLGFEAELNARDSAGHEAPREVELRWYRQLIWELMKRGFNIASVTFDGFQCLSGDTRIPLLDGTTKTMKELEGQKDFWVYSIKNGNVVPGLAKNARWTGFRSDMVEVLLDSGESIKATQDHLFMLRDGTYKPAGELTSGDSLMPLYRRMKKVSPTSKEYEQIWHPEADGAGNRWKFTHSMVSHHMWGKLPKGYVTHHIDHSKTNNSPENLVQVTNEEHYLLHTRYLNLDLFKNLWKDPEWSTSQKQRIALVQKSLLTGRTGKESKHYRHDIDFSTILEKYLELRQGAGLPTKDLMCSSLSISQDVLYARVRDQGYKSWKAFRDEHESVTPRNLYLRALKKSHKLEPTNHKVVSVTPCPPEDVYDLEVEEHHNFATEAGVFVHNSVDMIQILKMYGVAAARLSLDRGDKVYQSFKEALYSSRIIGYQHTALVEEFRKLMHTGRKVDHPPGGCFVGDTRIPLLDGTYPEIRDLDGKSVWVYSSTPDGKIVPGLARGRMTKETAELVDVILDNGYVARCTPEHRWMLRDGSYKEARLLKPGVDRLMPITFNWPINGGYTRLANKDGYRVLAHHMVSEFFEGRSRESDEVVHHINEVKTDNRPENLEMLTQLEHTTRHATERWDAIKPAFRDGYSVWIADEDKKKEVYSRRRNWRTRHDVTLDTILQAIRDGASNRNEVARLLKCDWNVISARLKKESLSFSEAIDLSNNNHKVRAVVPVYLDTPVPVYDLEVERFNNFALTGGVFVHNSKDLADSVAGAIYGAAVLVAGEGEDPISRYDAEPFSMSIPVSRIAGGFGSSDMGSLGFGGGGMSAPLGFG